MENAELLRRAEDLANRCERKNTLTCAGFFTPAECYTLRQWLNTRPEPLALLFGGKDECERQMLFFFPEYLEPDNFDFSEYFRAVKIKSYFGSPSHRDYLGAILNLGIRRESLGDLFVREDTAWLYCLPAVVPVLTEELTRVGRCSVKAAECALDEVPAPERKVRPVSFTVKSPRLDAVVSGMFGVSRSTAADAIRLGLVALNYSPCEKPDAGIKEGDTISFRGHGKGTIAADGGRSRKDRIFINAEIYE